MELSWFVWALLTTLSIGLVGFINKIIVEKKYNQGLSAISFYGAQSIIYLLLLIFLANYQVSVTVITFGILWGLLDYFYIRARFISLEGISSSLFFINARLFSSLALLLLGILFFGDIISTKEYIGFFLGFVVFALLFEKEKIKNENYKKGILFLGIGIVLIIIIHFGIKYITTILNNIFLLFFSYALTGLIIALMINRRNLKKEIKNKAGTIYWNVAHALLFFFYIYFLFRTYNLADLGIAYKIQSYSLFIPIILSIIVYNEKINTKKIIAFILTIISLWFFF